MDNLNSWSVKDLVIMLRGEIEKLENKLDKFAADKTLENKLTGLQNKYDDKINIIEKKMAAFEATQKEKLAANQRTFYIVGFIIMLINAAMAWHQFFAK